MTLKRNISVILVGLLLIIFTNTPCFAGVTEPDLEATLSETGSQLELPVILILSDKVDLSLFGNKGEGLLRSQLVKALREKSESTQRTLKSFLAEKGVTEVRSLWIINGMLIKARPGVIQEVANQPGVERVRLDQTQGFRDRFRGIRKQSPRNLRSKLRKTPKKMETMVKPPNLPANADPEWNVDLIQAPSLWKKNITGEGIVIASMDTGIDLNHVDLKDKWRGGKNSWFDPNGQHEIPHDSNGHGTQTMGIMVGGSSSGTSIGVAPGAKWIAVKIYNDAGQTSLGVCHLGFQWLLDPDGNPDTDDSPDVVNFSWGFNQFPNKCVPEFEEDVRVFRTAQIAVIFAGGNDGPHPSTSLSPANHANSLSVGAMEKSMHIATFSSRGPSACNGGIYPTLVAPGVIIRTADLTFNGVFPNSKAAVTGTSFAAAHATGAMALLKSALPHLTVSELELGLKESAQDLGETGPDHIYGYGMINLMAAYDYLLKKQGRTPFFQPLTLPLSPPACLREAASAKAGERVR